MILETLMAYSEVYEILNLLDKEYRDKVPNKVRIFFEEERLQDYQPKIDTDIPLSDQKLKRETIILLAILNLNYWCNTPEEKQEALNELANNEKESQKLLEKYNPENLFNNNQKDVVENKKEINTQDVSLVKYKKQGIIKRILDKITKFLKNS